MQLEVDVRAHKTPGVRAFTARPERVAFVMEQTLGHVAFSKNLAGIVARDKRIDPTWIEIPFACQDILDSRLCVVSPWALRGSLRAAARVITHGLNRFDALFVHTQTIALALPLVARSVPTVVSLDATPINYDTVGQHYNHKSAEGSTFERIKLAWYRQVFNRASELTTWSYWAKDSLVTDYGVQSARVTVIPPGVDIDLFCPQPSRKLGHQRPPRLLFVGGDFARKGGQLLLDSLATGLAQCCELHIVTSTSMTERPGVHVYQGLGPNHPKLIELYKTADIFVFPTLADCRAVVLSEAMAAGLPVITTSVAAQPEAVPDGKAGIIVPPGDVDALGGAIRRLIDDPDLRRAMGRRAREIAIRDFDARKNGRRLVDVIERAIAGRRPTAVGQTNL